LLDTNSWIHHLRHGSSSNVTTKLASISPGSAYLCSIVIGELVFGAYNGGPKHLVGNLALISSLRQQYPSLPLDDAAAEEYGKLRSHLKSLGTPIGPNDLLIAALALSEDLILVTHNTVEFSRVPGLKLEDRQ
jgi:tRNA(fMet)-specific endonuclease VapC